MNTERGRKELLLGVAAAVALSVSSAAVAIPVSADYVGNSCPGQCTDLATAGYSGSGGAVISAAQRLSGYDKTPGADTGNSGNVLSDNVTSKKDVPSGAKNPINVSGLNNAFEVATAASVPEPGSLALLGLGLAGLGLHFRRR